MGDKDQQANHDCHYRADQHGSSCDILRNFCQRMITGGSEIDAELDCRVEHFGNENSADDDGNKREFQGRNMEEQANENSEQGKSRMDAGVALRAQCVPESTKSVFEASKEAPPRAVRLCVEWRFFDGRERMFQYGYLRCRCLGIALFIHC